MQPHPDWTAIEHSLSVLGLHALSNLCAIYHAPNEPTDYALQNGCVVLNHTTDTTTIEKLLYSTLHELQHICLLHFERGKTLGAFKSERTRKIFNIAADVSVDISILSLASFGQGLVHSVYSEAKQHLNDLVHLVDTLAPTQILGIESLPTTEARYKCLLEKLSSVPNEQVLAIGTIGDVSQDKSDDIPMGIRFPQVKEHVEAGSSNEAMAAKARYRILSNNYAWARIYKYFKVTFGTTKMVEGHMSQRMMLNRSVGGLRLMSRNMRVDGSHNGTMNASHSDALILMDVSGSIERDWVDTLVGGIAGQLQQSNLRGATLLTYNSGIRDIVKLNKPSDITQANLRLGGGTNINRTLTQLKEHKDLMDNAKVIVVITDGEDQPIRTKLDVPILSVVFAELDNYNSHFIEGSIGTSLHMPELLC